jgi:hypothetical protein
MKRFTLILMSLLVSKVAFATMNDLKIVSIEQQANLMPPVTSDRVSTLVTVRTQLCHTPSANDLVISSSKVSGDAVLIRASLKPGFKNCLNIAAPAAVDVVVRTSAFGILDQVYVNSLGRPVLMNVKHNFVY